MTAILLLSRLVGSALLRLLHWYERDQFLDTPNMIRQTSFHSWSDAQCLMNAAEVVVREVQRNSMTMILNLL